MARYDIPQEVVSDSGPQFRSNDFKAFAKKYGFKHTLTSPYHHQLNGMAESAVKRAKRVLTVAGMTKCGPYVVLLDIQNTPQEEIDVSPVERMMNRQTRSPLHVSANLLTPQIITGLHEKIKQRQARQQTYYRRGTKNLKPLQEADPVLIQPQTPSDCKCKEARVTRQVEVRSYEVESDGKSYIRNRKHLKKAVDGAKSSHRMEDYPVSNTDLPVTKPHQEEPTQHKEPKASSERTTVTKQQSPNDFQTQERVTKTCSSRISVPPARFKDFVRF